MEEEKQTKDTETNGGRVALLDTIATEVLSENVLFQQRLE